MTLHYLIIVAGCCLAAYITGSIPFGLILGKIFGAGDIRQIGSGNIGATNMLRTGRKELAAATLILDFAKGIIGVSIAQGLCNYIYTYKSGDLFVIPDITCFAAVAAVLGHVFPLWLKFKGGKGVATTLGVFFATEPSIALVTVMGWVLIFYLTRVSSLAALCSIVCAPILGFMYTTHTFGFMATFLAILIVYTHRENIKRLREGKENKVKADDEPS